MIEWLLDQGIDPNLPMIQFHLPYIKDQYGEHDYTNAALNAAAAEGDVEMFDYLVTRGAQPSLAIPLHHVSKCKDHLLTERMIEHLIEKYSFDVNANDTCGGLRWYGPVGPARRDTGTPLQLAIQRENTTAITSLRKYGSSEHFRPATVDHGQFIAGLQILLDAGVDPTGCYGLVSKPFKQARFEERVEKIRLAAMELCLTYGAREEKQLGEDTESSSISGEEEEDEDEDEDKDEAKDKKAEDENDETFR